MHSLQMKRRPHHGDNEGLSTIKSGWEVSPSGVLSSGSTKSLSSDNTLFHICFSMIGNLVSEETALRPILVVPPGIQVSSAYRTCISEDVSENISDDVARSLLIVPWPIRFVSCLLFLHPYNHFVLSRMFLPNPAQPSL